MNKQLTKEQLAISRKNRYAARNYFNLTTNCGMDLHHKDISMKSENINRYIEWNPEDLIVLTHEEHTALHNTIRLKGKHHTKKAHWSDESKKRHSEARKGKGNPNYGKKHPGIHKGIHWKLVDGIRKYYY